MMNNVKSGTPQIEHYKPIQKCKWVTHSSAYVQGWTYAREIVKICLFWTKKDPESIVLYQMVPAQLRPLISLRFVAENPNNGQPHPNYITEPTTRSEPFSHVPYIKAHLYKIAHFAVQFFFTVWCTTTVICRRLHSYSELQQPYDVEFPSRG
jgi:hypothetical protein